MRLFKRGWYVALFLVGLVFSFGSMAFCQQNVLLEDAQRSQRKLYHASSVSFEGKGLLPDRLFSPQFMKSIQGKALYQEEYGSDSVRCVLASAAYPAPKLEWGRFFSEDDADGAAYRAVVGKGMLPELSSAEGRRYYLHGETRYEVIGVLAYPEESEAGRSVLLSANRENLVDGLSVLDPCDQEGFAVFQENTPPYQGIKEIERPANAPEIQGLENVAPFLAVIFMAGYFILLMYCKKRNQLEFYLRRMSGQNPLCILLLFLTEELSFGWLGIVAGGLAGAGVLLSPGEQGAFFSALGMQIVLLAGLTLLCNVWFYLSEGKAAIFDKVR